MYDSQAAIPLATLTARRVNNLYNLIDSAYDTSEIRAFSTGWGMCRSLTQTPQATGGESREEAGGPGAALYRPSVSRGPSLPRTLDRGTGERAAKG